MTNWTTCPAEERNPRKISRANSENIKPFRFFYLQTYAYLKMTKDGDRGRVSVTVEPSIRIGNGRLGKPPKDCEFKLTLLDPRLRREH